MNKPYLLYTLHSGNLYGTEKMALITLQNLTEHFEPILFCPPGPIIEYAATLTITTHQFLNPRQLAQQLRHYLALQKPLAFMSTALTHSLLFIGLNLYYRTSNIHLHMVHGGTDEKESYARKKWLNHFSVQFIAVSSFVRERLLAHHVRKEQITVINNFLSNQEIKNFPQRPPFTSKGIQNIIIISRIDPIKRVDLILDMLDKYPALSSLNIKVYGTGWEFEQLQQRAIKMHHNVKFMGFSSAIQKSLIQADLLLHLCPQEPFGLVFLEAMAACVPVLAPNKGGAAIVIKANINGFHFNANDIDDLAQQLLALQQISASKLNHLVKQAHHILLDEFSARARIPDYQQLLQKDKK